MSNVWLREEEKSDLEQYRDEVYGEQERLGTVIKDLLILAERLQDVTPNDLTADEVLYELTNGGRIEVEKQNGQIKIKNHRLQDQ